MSSRRRRRHAGRSAAVVVLAAAVAAGTFLVGRWTAPLRTDSGSASKPPPAVLVATARRQITLTLDVTATVKPAGQATIPLLPPADVARTVVTATPMRVGAAVTAGKVIIEISGRPVIALPGKVPAYRDLSTGDIGWDVKELQAALRQLGYFPDTDGVFGAATGEAVIAFYNDRGYAAITPTAKTVSVAAGELAFLPQMPVKLGALPGGVGTDPSGKAITVDSTADPVVIAQLNATASASAPSGTPVVLQCGAAQVRGRLAGGAGSSSAATIDENASTSTDLVSRPVELAKAVPPLTVGTICAGTATVAVTQAPVLAVPSSAVYDTSDHGTVVQVRAAGTTTTVPVSVGRSGGGWVEITDPPTSLHPGTQLLIGASPR